MSKGKKFNAAEKHFNKKEEQLRKRMNDAEAAMLKMSYKMSELEQEKITLQQSLEDITKERDTLLKRLQMSPEDLQRAIKVEKHLETISACFNYSSY